MSPSLSSEPSASGEKSEAVGEEPSVFYLQGAAAKKARKSLKNSGVYNLRFGCQQQDDFLAGYDGMPWSARSK